MRPNTRGRYWIVGPDYRQARVEFTYLFNAFANLNMVGGKVSMPMAETSPWSFEAAWGAIFQTRSSNDIAKLASFSVNGAMMVEGAQQENEVFLKLLGRVAETDGFLILSGTLEEGQSWYTELYKRWQGDNPLGAKSWSLPTWSNEIIFPGGMENERIQELQATYPEDLFWERFGAVPRKISGLVIPEFDFAEHVKNIELVPNVPVELAIDPGQHCYVVLFVQKLGLKVHVLDRIYARNRIAQDIIPEAMTNPLWKLIDPARAGVIDVAGTQRHANKSQVELWKEMAGIVLRSQYIHLQTTIDTVRFRLKKSNPLFEPLVLFSDHLTDAKTPNGFALDVLAEFDLWKWPKRSRDADHNTPINPIDRNNDAIKALGYYLVDAFGAYVDKPTLPPPTRVPYWGVPNVL